MFRSIALRPVDDEDLPFLYACYASARADELAPLNWDQQTHTAFLTMQFNAQHQYYREHYADAEFRVIVVEGRPAGRIYVAWLEDGLRLMEITLLPSFRNQGIGTALVRQVLDEAARAGKQVRLHVEPFNPALRLYQRLGFVKLEDRGVYWFMGWTPPDPGSG